MDILRHDDGSLTVPIEPARDAGDFAEPESTESGFAVEPDTLVLRPGEGGYTEALAKWDQQQNPDRDAPVSTAAGRAEAMAVIHAVADDPEHVADAVEALEDPEASAEALRHVLVGGTPSVQAFASEVAAAEGGDELPAHQATKIIGTVLAEMDNADE